MTHRTHEEVIADLLRNDPQLRRLWEAHATKREVTKAMIGERIKRNLTPKQLAQESGE